MTLPELEAQIAKTEEAFRRLFGPLHDFLGDELKEMYADREELKRVEKLGKTNLN